jgi:hypothetical protein
VITCAHGHKNIEVDMFRRAREYMRDVVLGNFQVSDRPKTLASHPVSITPSQYRTLRRGVEERSLPSQPLFQCLQLLGHALHLVSLLPLADQRR